VAIEWFVRCRGRSPKQDYVWLDSMGKQPPWVEPPIHLDPRVFSGGGLQAGLGGFSTDGRAVAFVDGLRSAAAPRDFANRPISIAFLGVADATSYQRLAAVLQRAVGPERDALAASVVEMRDDLTAGFSVKPTSLEAPAFSLLEESTEPEVERSDRPLWGPPELLGTLLEDACRKLMHDGVRFGDVLFARSEILTQEWCHSQHPYRAVSPLLAASTGREPPLPVLRERNPKSNRPRLLVALGAFLLVMALTVILVW
jgi:hypothetical protein